MPVPMNISLIASLAFFSAVSIQDAPAVSMQEAAPEAVEADAVTEMVKVRLATDKGDIVIALDRAAAPITADNFLGYVDKGWLDGQPFYRAMPYGDDGGLAQFGVRDGSKLLDPVEHEPTSETGLTHERGAIALINSGVGTGRNDFFILTTDIEGFDAKDDGSPGFAVFGHVVEGMDVVDAIFASPTDPDAGEGVMKGQMLSPQVMIRNAGRAD